MSVTTADMACNATDVTHTVKVKSGGNTVFEITIKFRCGDCLSKETF